VQVTRVKRHIYQLVVTEMTAIRKVSREKVTHLLESRLFSVTTN